MAIETPPEGEASLGLAATFQAAVSNYHPWQGNAELGRFVATSDYEVTESFLTELARLDRTYSDTDKEGNEFVYEGDPCHEDPDIFIELATEACIDAKRTDLLSLFLSHHDDPLRIVDLAAAHSLIFDQYDLLTWAAEHGFSLDQIEAFIYSQGCLASAFDEPSSGETAEWLASHTGSHAVLLQAVCDRVYEVCKGEGLIWRDGDPPNYVVQGRLRVRGWLKKPYEWARRLTTAATAHAPGILDNIPELRGMTAAERAMATQDSELIAIICAPALAVQEGAAS